MKNVMTVVVLAMCVSAGLHARQEQAAARPAAASAEETAAVARGWALYASGDLDQALAAADQALERYPMNPSAIDLVIDITLARFGAMSALDRYERWLGAREIEHTFGLRRIARGVLREAAVEQSFAQLDAQRALLEDGDDLTAAALAARVAEGRPTDLQLLAAQGDAPAIKAIVAAIDGPLPMQAGLIRALGDSRSAEAVPGLVRLLDDPRPDVRMEAASSLRRIASRDAIPALRARLQDMYPPVRIQAAAALYAMDDSSGIVELLALAESEHDAVRVGIAEVMAARPDAGWQQRVRALVTSADPMVQVRSATLLATFDRDAAQAVLEGLTTHESLPIREVASRTLAADIVTDLTMLRKILRAPDALTRTGAAARILTATR